MRRFFSRSVLVLICTVPPVMAGQAEPHVADQKIALEESDRRLAFLDREVQALKNEMEIRRTISSNTLLTVLSRQAERDVTHGLRQPVHQNDGALHRLNHKAVP